ncbi:hypothetical protein G6F50_017143 [Rhizopus delemar]|uniref:Cbb3-type cytochrome c oxidase subunit CcoP N-terminal domain-containing protein n=1 Tax=Rhizopus delemar TaxID=936053 RepID=A0A9P6XQY0_9FUNG|nr:hypothetical protein G6F50_017143 [Rhizopus delemar]
MSDFVNGFWGYFISVVAVGGVVWCVWLLYTQRRWLTNKPANGQVEDTGHVWDGDLTELNNPVPTWWTWMYLLACVFALGYLFFMPGLGQDGRGRAPDLRALRDHDRAAGGAGSGRPGNGPAPVPEYVRAMPRL